MTTPRPAVDGLPTYPKNIAPLHPQTANQIYGRGLKPGPGGACSRVEVDSGDCIPLYDLREVVSR